MLGARNGRGRGGADGRCRDEARDQSQSMQETLRRAYTETKTTLATSTPGTTIIAANSITTTEKAIII